MLLRDIILYAGPTGYTGYTGTTGYTGYTGRTGYTGYTGYTGTTGYTGPTNGREVLSANRTYYVRTDGSDSNTGLSNTAGAAFLTIQKAYNVILTLDLSGYTATIKLGNTGTWTAGLSITKAITGGGAVELEGDTTTPSNTVISTTSANCIYLMAHMTLTIRAVKLQTTTAGNCVFIDLAGASIVGSSGLVFGACAESHIKVAGPGVFACYDNYTINGGAAAHMYSHFQGTILEYGQTITVSGTPHFTDAFAFAGLTGMIDARAITYSGSATGPRYNSGQTSVIYTGGGGATYFPGDAAGTGSTTDVGYYL
jgi:hypothetical protein